MGSSARKELMRSKRSAQYLLSVRVVSKQSAREV